MSIAEWMAKARQLERKLEIKDRKYKLKTYRNCFVGTDCVKTILKLKYAHNEEQAVEFGNQLIQYGIIQHVEKHHTFKNCALYYKFVDGYHNKTGSNDSAHSMLSLSSPSNSSSVRSSSRYSGFGYPPRHRTGASNLTISNVTDLLSRSGQSYLRRKDVYFRVNKYMRQNRLNDANAFLQNVLKYVANKASIDWSVLEGPTLNNIDINYITNASKEKELQDIMGESVACWIDVTLLECKLKLFYEYHDNDEDGNNIKCKQCINKFTSILDALQRSLNNNPNLILQSYYYRFIECESRANLAYAIVKSTKIGYAAYSGLAFEHCRKAMKLNPFHSLSHAMYGYLLNRCLDKFEESRQYLEYAIHLNNYYDSVNIIDDKKDDENKKNDDKKTKKDKKDKKDKTYNRFAYIHVWLATLLVNFEEEFREIEYRMEVELRNEFTKKYRKTLKKKKNKKQNINDDDNDNDNDDDMILTNREEEEDDAIFDDNKQESICLVKQLSHAHAYHRKRESITRQLMNHYSESQPQSPYQSMDDFGGQISTEITDFDIDNEININLGNQSPSYTAPSSTHNSFIGDLPKPMALQPEESQNVQNMIAERLTDDTLTKHIGMRFGADFMDQMNTISDKPDDHFLAALKLEPQNSKFHSVYGIFLIQQEKFDAAKPHLEKAIKYDPNNVISLNNLGWTLSLPKFSQYQQAKKYLIDAAKLRPKNASIQFNLARLLAHAFGTDELQNAKRYYLAALTHDQQNTHIHFFYAIFLRFILNDNESAKIHLTKSDTLLHITDDMTFEVNGYIQHAKILQHESKFKAARFLLQRAAKLDITKKREITQLLQSIQADEKELNMLKQQQ